MTNTLISWLCLLSGAAALTWLDIPASLQASTGGPYTLSPDNMTYYGNDMATAIIPIVLDSTSLAAWEFELTSAAFGDEYTTYGPALGQSGRIILVCTRTERIMG